MTPDQRQAACDLLYRHWREGTRLENLPEDLRPTSRAEAYDVQGCIEAHTSQPLYGWKIAANFLRLLTGSLGRLTKSPPTG